MSYIGKNPKADSLKLTSTSTAASGTDEGQVYYNDGTGTISEGLKVYKNGNFVGIDKQLGDADTIALKKAVDVGGLQWAVAINSTGATVGMNAPVPQYDATATGFIAASTFSNTSTGNALLTDESADLVFAYESHATNSKNDYWGIQVDIPKAFRGGNLVLSFEYRTEEASGATSDDDFRFSVQDNTTANRGQTIGGTGVTGSQAAGTSILVGSSSNFSVGDSVRVESGTGIQGAQANDFTEAYVTAIADATHLTFSQTIVFPSTVGALIAGGWLTPMVGGQLAEADSDTNKVGKKRSIQFKTLETTETVNVTFQNLSTSAAGIDLFVDNILLSANKFLQASSQGLPETAFFSGDAGHYSTYTPYFTTEHINTVDKVGTFQNGSSTTYTYFEAKVRCLVSCNFWYYNDGVGGGYSALIKNDLSSTNPEAVSLDSKRVAFAYAADFRAQECSVSIVLEKGDTLRPASEDGNASATLNGLHLTATPLVNDVIILESQDEIFTDWVSYDITRMKKTASDANHDSTGFGTTECNEARWRRVGDTMELQWNFRQSTAGSAGTDGTYVIPLPSGYSIDVTKVGASNFSSTNAGVTVGNGRICASADTTSAQSKPATISVTEDVTWGVLLGTPGVSGGYLDDTHHMWASGSFDLSTNPLAITLKARVPISGWNANFNPLLSMPLVDIGADVESLVVDEWSGTAVSYSVYSTNLVNGLSSLATLTNTSTTGFYITANTDLIVDASWHQRRNDVGSYVGIVSGPASIWDYTRAIQSTGWDGYRYAVTEEAQGYVNSCSATIKVPAGHIVGFISNNTNPAFAGELYGGASIVCKRDRSHTNMAHIIKPAVAIVKNVQSSTTNGGTASSTGAFETLTLNTIVGESWFVSLSGTTGFTLEPGTYEVDATNPFYRTNYSQIILYDATNSVNQAIGRQLIVAGGAADGSGDSFLHTVFTLTASTTFNLKYRVSTTVATNGLGASANLGVESIYAQVKIRKLK